MSQDCLFCRIVRGEIAARVVHEDDECLAFHDIAPVAPTHVLVIPKRHVSSLAETGADDASLLGHLLVRTIELARALGAEGGYRVVANSGADAGQSVDHLHIHLLAGRPLTWPPG